MIIKINITNYALDDINLLLDNNKCKKFLQENYDDLKDKSFYLNISKIYYLHYKEDVCCSEIMRDDWEFCPYCGNPIRDVEIECETLEGMKKELKEEELLEYIDEVEVRYIAIIDIKGE